MKIGIVCYPTYGGSGVVATELGRWLAQRGHEIHFVSHARPFRLAAMSEENVQYHKVDLLDYHVFPSPSYTLSLASKIAHLIEENDLEIIHVHYAVPHAVSAYLARQIVAPRRAAVVTTLHGTDITLLGSEPGLQSVIRFAIEHSDAVTAVSRWLRDQTRERLALRNDVEVVPNFVDVEIFKRSHLACPARRFILEGERVILHISNFRPVKRVDDVVRAFARIRQKHRVRLILVGDGPERERIEDLARDEGVLGATVFVGRHSSPECFFSVADLFLLPSRNEAFGLAALEAMGAEVPVIGYLSGGLPEVVRDGETGFLVPFGDVEAMAARAIELLDDPDRARAMGQRGRQVAIENYLPEHIVPQYEKIYQSALDAL